MAYSSACFSTANVIETDMQQVEDNFDALRDHLANSTGPTSPRSGQRGCVRGAIAGEDCTRVLSGRSGAPVLW